jgi:cupredoxin-like protein
MTTRTQTSDTSPALRWTVIAAIAGVAFFGSYRFAIASQTSAAENATGAVSSESLGTPVADSGSGSGGGGCCGGGGPAITKAAELKGGVQTVTVDLSSGSYDPNTIELKAGVPAEITFGLGGGCLSQVQSQELGFYEDLTSGPKTIKLGALEPGTYGFTCGMNMVSGSIVVK